jgi:endonuclease-3 related protein
VIGFRALFDELLATHGPQRWWPADDPFEIMLGSILVQRTAWRNAEVAIAALRERALLRPAALAAIEPLTLAPLIRSAGFFRTKASRLRGLAEFVVESGGVQVLAGWPTSHLRGTLLRLDGIGPETADAILLYAFDRPVVVIDAYLRRLVGRLHPTGTAFPDDRLREAVMAEINDAASLNEFHALVVEHGKRLCATRPNCAECRLRQRCQFGRNEFEA